MCYEAGDRTVLAQRQPVLILKAALQVIHGTLLVKPQEGAGVVMSHECGVSFPWSFRVPVDSGLT